LQAKHQALLCAAYALDKKAFNVRLLDVGGQSSLTDFLLIVSGGSDRQVQAISEAIELGMKKEHNVLPLAVEGKQEGRWVLLDYGDVMVHVFQQPVRQYYDLEGLWPDAPEVPVEEIEEA
jgi:ribosome-associated protein